ncbi:MAG: HD domain-containing protein [Candidatus Eisenbacteria bacterium]|nr:HD domain-containing protein [Candidatus Eisenbacteria bacterium]
MSRWRDRGGSRFLEVILQANELKTIPRMGWRVRGVTGGESVADHSYAVSFIAMLLADRMKLDIDVEKVLRIAILHDLPEHMLGDIHAPAARFLGEKEKEATELRILENLFEGLEEGERYLSLWREFADRSSVEGKLVRAADKIEMFTQAFQYEAAGNRMLDDFWDYVDNTRDFEFDEVERLFAELLELRQRERQQEQSGTS